MPAPTGNKNAEKYTAGHTAQILAKMLTHARDDDYWQIGESLADLGLYSELWSRLKRKWRDKEELYDSMMHIEQYYENKLIRGAMSGRFRGSAVMLVLKTKYGYKEYTSERTGQDTVPELKEENTQLRQELGQTKEALHRKEREVSKPPMLKLTPPVNAGTFHIETELGAETGEYIITNHINRIVHRTPYTGQRQFFDLSDQPGGVFTATLHTPIGSTIGYFNIEAKDHRHLMKHIPDEYRTA